MGREIRVKCGIWRSLWGWYRRSVSFGKDFVEVLCDRFPIQQSGSRYLIVVGQNDTQSFLHQNIPNFYCNVKSFVPDGQSLSNLRDKFLTNIYIGQPVQSS